MKPLSPLQRFSHTLAIVEGTALAPARTGQLFFLDPVHSVVLAAERLPRGSTFDTRDLGPVLTSEDTAFRPVYIVNAPDGALYLADFYEHYIAHGQHYQSQIDPTTGRLYRLRAKGAKLERDVNLARKTADELIALLSHPNKWHRQVAVRLLGERKDPASLPKLRALLAKTSRIPTPSLAVTPLPEETQTKSGPPADSPEAKAALGALWALHQAGALEEATALVALSHRYAPVRLWAIRLLGDRKHLSEPLAAVAVEQARSETNIEVRAQIASSARRLPAGQALRVVTALLEHDEDRNDPFVPLLCWWVLEAQVSTNCEPVLSLFRQPALWDRTMVQDHILPRLMRRFALEGRRQDLLVCAQLLGWAPSQHHAAQLMKGFEEAYRGRALIGLPKELLAAMAARGSAPLSLRVRQGEAAAIEEALRLIQDHQAKLEDRLLFTRSFGELREPKAVPVLLGVACREDHLDLRKAAFSSLNAYDDEVIGEKVIEVLPRLPANLRTAALASLVSRSKWSLELLHALQAARLSPAGVPSEIAERLRLSADRTVSELAARLFPKTRIPTSPALQERVREIESILKRGAGNPYSGEALFAERCAGCHKLFFKGGNLGPDLTAYQRDNLSTMLLSIVNPNAEIREGYQYVQVETTDGRSLGGFLAEGDLQVTVLRGLDGQDLTLRHADLKAIEPMGRSLMPEGLLDDLSEQQLRDLFAFLRASQPITK
jgi:putative heme-binding domain-containing protein